MVLFVKRTCAIKVSSTSRIDQGSGGGGGGEDGRETGPRKEPGEAGPLRFSEGWAGSL